MTPVSNACWCTLSDAHRSCGSLILSFVIERRRNFLSGSKFGSKRDSRWSPERHVVVAAHRAVDTLATCAIVVGEATQPVPERHVVELRVVVAANCPALN